MLVSIRAYYVYEDKARRLVKKVELKEKSTITDLLNVVYKSTGLPTTKGDAGWNDLFLGELLMKNGCTIGHFRKDGLKLRVENEIELRDGDEITIMNPIGGG